MYVFDLCTDKNILVSLEEGFQLIAMCLTFLQPKYIALHSRKNG